MVQSPFEIDDSGKKMGGGSGRHTLFRKIFTVALLRCGCTSKGGKIKLLKCYSKHYELKNL